MKKFIVGLFLVGFILGGKVFADEFITDDIATQEVKVKRDLNIFQVNAQNNTVIITVIKKFLDAEGNVLRTKDGKNFIYRNTPATETEPACNDYNIFFQQLGISKTSLKNAVNFMQSR